ncbi:MAG: ribonucleotide-diphosphate reductase subunit alpha, partial [Alphaproteobacteria bacterium]|nr:ribonucleotide-diphosphate reductase subunit alpha [Alphaproteobacteria bacterium]
IEPIAANSYTHKTLSGSYTVRNRHLKRLLAALSRDDDETWSSISTNEGSVQHLDCLDENQKAVFRTAFEIDQRWLIEHAADRTPFICQSQSLNLFLPADVHKRDLHQLHFQAWKKGVKSLYYCRSKSIQRAETVARDDAMPAIAKLPHLGWVNSDDRPAENGPADYEECLACQ